MIAIIGIVFAICGKFFLRIFFGMEYVDSYEISTILLIGVFCMSFYKIIGQLLISDGKSKHYFLILLFGAIINVIINIVLIPNYNILGAAFASVFSYAIIGLIFLIYYIKKYNTKLSELLFVKNSDLNKVRNLISHYLGGKKYEKRKSNV